MMFKDRHKNKNREEQESAAEKPADIKQLEAELQILREELSKKDNCQDMLLRLQADFDNFRKRSAKERQEFIKYANEALIFELVGMLDNFERSIKAADQKQDFKLLHQGVDMISKQLHKLLEEKGLRRIGSQGEKFDPSRHEAIEAVETDEVEDGCILEEFQPGYMLNDRVIRPAMVKVAKGKKEEPEVVEEENKCHSAPHPYSGSLDEESRDECRGKGEQVTEESKEKNEEEPQDSDEEKEEDDNEE
jgi:molecular chaperone GrpE